MKSIMSQQDVEYRILMSHKTAGKPIYEVQKNLQLKEFNS